MIQRSLKVHGLTVGIKPFDQLGITILRSNMRKRLHWVFGLCCDVILAAHLDFPAGRIDTIFPNTFLDFGSVSSACSCKCGRSQGLNTLLLELCRLSSFLAPVLGFRFFESCFCFLPFLSLVTF